MNETEKVMKTMNETEKAMNTMNKKREKKDERDA